MQPSLGETKANIEFMKSFLGIDEKLKGYIERRHLEPSRKNEMDHDTRVYEIHCVSEMYYGGAGLFGFGSAREVSQLKHTLTDI